MIIITDGTRYLEWEGTAEEFDASSLPKKGFSIYTGVWPIPVPPIDYTESNKAQLWEAAHQWEFSKISGVGLSLLALGVAQGKQKCIANAMWAKSLWNDVYDVRKLLITSAQIAPEQLDFSAAGEMPFTVQQMSDEVYGA